MKEVYCDRCGEKNTFVAGAFNNWSYNIIGFHFDLCSGCQEVVQTEVRETLNQTIVEHRKGDF